VSTVLVTGPTGKVGRRLVPLLARRGITVRAASAPPETAEHNSQLYVHAHGSGALGVLNDDVLDVTGRPPVSFAEFAVGAAAAWRR